MYRVDLVMTGFPGRSTEHGPLGWSTVGLLRGAGRTVLVDTGGPAYREPLLLGLRQRGVSAQDVTDVLITHCHWDHVSNYTLFPRARIVVPGAELEWAAAQPPGTWHLAELHVARLASGTDDVALVAAGQEVAPGITTVATPGHTPGHVAYRAATADGEVVFAGDAVKNRVELRTGEVDLTLDAEKSRRSIDALWRLVASDPDALLLPGHDVPLRVAGDAVVAQGHVSAGVAVLLDDTGEPTVIDLGRRPATSG